MAAQLVLFAETIMGMKKAMARKDDASDSDSIINRPTNRGNKLKRKAKYVQEARLDLADGPRVYRRKLDYNGYTRHIISRNPLRVDADGDVVDDDDSDALPDLSDAEENPYSDVLLEEILMPLTSAANLNKHPSLAVAYTNKALEEMIKNAREMMEREQAALYKVKRLMVEFRGDDTWMPCGSLQTEHDSVLLGPQRLAALAQATSNAFGPNWESLSADLTMTDPESVVDMGILPEHDLAPGDMTENAAVHDAYEGIANVNEDADGRAESPERGAQSHTPEHQIEHDVIPSTETRLLVKEEGGAPMEVDHPEPQSAGPDATTATIDHAPGTEHNDATNITKAEENTEDMAEGLGADDDAQDTTAERPHRMTTRARAHASGADEATLPSPTQTSHPSPAPSVPSIHPFFMVPASALPSRDFNLPYDEAGDSRRLLSSYVQKQEEVCRGVARLLAGLQKALRLRRTVWQWCRAEGHVGEMSDGEDWYDREEWGLEEDLKKGEEAEEEEVVPGKKTRHRRAVA